MSYSSLWNVFGMSTGVFLCAWYLVNLKLSISDAYKTNQSTWNRHLHC